MGNNVQQMETHINIPLKKIVYHAERRYKTVLKRNSCKSIKTDNSLLYSAAEQREKSSLANFAFYFLFVFFLHREK